MAKYRDPKVRVAKPYAGARRIQRAPQHTFQLKTRPFQIQPFMISPVLPGETLLNLVHQSRTVTNPIKDKLCGWWTEHFYFYVRLRDIEFHAGQQFVDAMVTDPANYNPAAMRTSADPKFYHAAGGTNWARYALQTIVEYYFRDQGEDWDVSLLDGLPMAQVANKTWLDSLTLDDEKRDAERDVNMDLNDDGDITVQEAITAQEIWQAQRDAGLEQMDYEDWIRTFGVTIPEEPTSFNEHKPELLRYYRQWQYPVNTVDPVSGTPSSAVSWVSAFTADKNRMFKEPGFIIGLQVTKPKVYIKDVTGSLANFMERLENWLPALSHAHYEKGFINFGPAAGPAPNQFTDGTDPQGYWVDFRDLLVHGDQFLNFAPAGASTALSVLTPDGGRRYAEPSEIDGLFKDVAKNVIDTDGVVNLRISGRQRDRTPGARTI